MPETKTKVSLYFPEDLFEEFEKARKEEEYLIGVTLSKNEFALRLIRESLNKEPVNPNELDLRKRVQNLEKTLDEINHDIKDYVKSTRLPIAKDERGEYLEFIAKRNPEEIIAAMDIINANAMYREIVLELLNNDYDESEADKIAALKTKEEYFKKYGRYPKGYDTIED
ncbi:MAG: hypothetical protein PHV39_09125 [Methanomicrobium sp.]|nr:hypothetical protein [Methanomicrobium sp.]